LKPEWWGSPLAQGEKYQGRKKPVTRNDDDNNNNNNKNNNNNNNNNNTAMGLDSCPHKSLQIAGNYLCHLHVCFYLCISPTEFFMDYFVLNIYQHYL
jgi:hypothetical protein